MGISNNYQNNLLNNSSLTKEEIARRLVLDVDENGTVDEDEEKLLKYSSNAKEIYDNFVKNGVSEELSEQFGNYYDQRAELLKISKEMAEHDTNNEGISKDAITADELWGDFENIKDLEEKNTVFTAEKLIMYQKYNTLINISGLSKKEIADSIILDIDGNGKIDDDEKNLLKYSSKAKSAYDTFVESGFSKDFVKKFGEYYDKKDELLSMSKLMAEHDTNNEGISKDELWDDFEGIEKIAKDNTIFTAENLINYKNILDIDNDGNISDTEKANISFLRTLNDYISTDAVFENIITESDKNTLSEDAILFKEIWGGVKDEETGEITVNYEDRINFVKQAKSYYNIVNPVKSESTRPTFEYVDLDETAYPKTEVNEDSKGRVISYVQNNKEIKIQYCDGDDEVFADKIAKKTITNLSEDPDITDKKICLEYSYNNNGKQTSVKEYVNDKYIGERRTTYLSDNETMLSQIDYINYDDEGVETEKVIKKVTQGFYPSGALYSTTTIEYDENSFKKTLFNKDFFYNTGKDMMNQHSTFNIFGKLKKFTMEKYTEAGIMSVDANVVFHSGGTKFKESTVTYYKEKDKPSEIIKISQSNENTLERTYERRKWTYSYTSYYYDRIYYKYDANGKLIESEEKRYTATDPDPSEVADNENS